MTSFPTIAHIMHHRGVFDPRGTAFVCLDAAGKELASITWEKLLKRVLALIAQLHAKFNLRKGAKVALVYRKSEAVENAVALYACFFMGLVAVPIVHMDNLSELKFILASTNTKAVLSTDVNVKAFSKDLARVKQPWPHGLEWIKTNEVTIHRNYFDGRGQTGAEQLIARDVDLAYLEFSKNFSAQVKGVGISHRTIMAQCQALHYALWGENGQKSKTHDVMLSYIEPRQQVGFIFALLYGVFSGNKTILLPPSIMDTPGLWVHLLTKYRGNQFYYRFEFNNLK